MGREKNNIIVKLLYYSLFFYYFSLKVRIKSNLYLDGFMFFTYFWKDIKIHSKFSPFCSFSFSFYFPSSQTTNFIIFPLFLPPPPSFLFFTVPNITLEKCLPEGKESGSYTILFSFSFKKKPRHLLPSRLYSSK